MNEQDKILLSAYLDSDLNDTETAHVEELLQSSDEARDYLESMKQVKLENKNFFENSLQSQSFKESSSFLKELQSKQTKKFSFSDFLFERKLLFSNLGTLSAAFLIFLVTTDPGVNVENGLSDFSEEVLEQEFFKYRGADDQAFLNDAILKMHLTKSKKSFVRYGSEAYLIEIEDVSFDTPEMKCYKFVIGILDSTSTGIGCVKNNESVEIISSPSN